MTHALRVLIVEDPEEVITPSLIAFFTSATGIHMAGAVSSISQAREIAKAQIIDVAVLDIPLSDGNGLVLLKWLKHNYPKVVVIMLSNSSDGFHRAVAKVRGAEYFFDKSTEYEQMLRAISKLAEIQPK
jgi:DNA-binding NtrC family response regulator